MMQELNLDRFNPTLAETQELILYSENLEKPSLDDKEGYEKIKNTRIKLRDMRVSIEKDGKAFRAEALAFQKAVIVKEKEYTSLIEPAEARLKGFQDGIDNEKEKIKRREQLPTRRQVMDVMGVEVTDDFLLGFSNEEFTTYYNQKHSEVLAEKERKLQEEQEKMDAEKRRVGEEAAARDREEKDKELKRLQALEKENRRVADEKEKEEFRAKELEANKKYTNFLKKNGATDLSGEWYVKKTIGLKDTKVELFKKVDEIIL